MKLVVIVRPIDQEMRDGRMMTRLLHEDLGSILPIALESLTKDRVQWLLIDLLLIEVADLLYDD